MARYVFTYTVDGECKLYAESSLEEERLDIDENGERLIEMTGGGYLAFWERCKRMVSDYRRIAEAYANNSLVSDKKADEFMIGTTSEGVITDLDSGMEKTIA